MLEQTRIRRRNFSRVIFLLISILLFLIPQATLFAQAPDVLWKKTYGGPSYDRFYSVKQTSYGDFICLGETFSYGGNQVYGVKVDKDGTVIWEGPYDKTQGWDVLETNDGCFLVVGDCASPKPWIVLIKIDDMGNIQWTNKFGGDINSRGYEIQNTLDGGYIIVGMNVRQSGWNTEDAYLVKTDVNGQVEWIRSYGGSQRDEGMSVKQTSDGGYIIAGYTNSYGAGSYDGYLLRTNSEGDIVWTETYGGTDEDIFTSIQIVQGGYIIAGYTASKGAGKRDVWVLYVDENGGVLDESTFGTSMDDRASHLECISTGGYIIAGQTMARGYILQIDENLNQIWSYMDENPGSLLAVEELLDGGFITAGAFGSTGDDAYLIRFGSTNQPPEVSANGPYSTNEGDDVSVMATGSDPDDDPLTYAWDLDNDGDFETPGQNATFSAAEIDGPSSHIITVRVTDDGGLSATDQTTVEVLNVAPTADFTVSSGVIPEGQSTTLLFSNPTDPSQADIDAGFLYSYDCMGDGTFEMIDGTDVSFSCTYPDNGNFNGTGRIKDKDGGFTDYTIPIIVNNMPPVVGEITAPVDPVEVNTPIEASADFTDAGAYDTHTAVWKWGDETSSVGEVTEANGSGSVTGDHTYTSAGVYTITLTVTDNDGDSGSSEFRYVVVYDPSAGFVTGGGWIYSPEGAYTPDDNLSGKASFGFVSKYKKGADEPTGQTNFNFHVASMHFHSSSYQWLVIAGSKAKYKGEGTINDTGEYGFMLSATDGQMDGGTNPDRFRIKIWVKTTEDVIYDNQMGDADDSDAADAIEGGNIKIHKEGDKLNKGIPVDLTEAEALPEEFGLFQNYPNPFNPETQIRYAIPEQVHVRMDIYNVTGKKVRTLAAGVMNAGYHSVSWDGRDGFGNAVSGGLYLCRIQAGNYQQTIRMLLMK